MPTYGAIIVDPSYEHILLVQGFYSRESWGFPKGKVQENESPIKCAIREVKERISFPFYPMIVKRLWKKLDSI